MPTIPVKVKPQLFRLPTSSWCWYLLSELAEVLGWEPEKVWNTFRDLAMDNGFGGPGALHWIDLDGNVCCNHMNSNAHHSHFGVHPEPTNYASIFVPAGWGNDVLTVRDWGVVRLGREEYLKHSGRRAPRGSLRSTFDGDKMLAIIGFTGPNDYERVSGVHGRGRRGQDLPLLSGV